MGRPDLGALIAQTMAPPEEGRSIETITGEILEAKRAGGEAILTIGRCLIEAKDMLSHGEWLPWLTEKVEFSPRTAQNFMRLAREWSNTQTLAHLGASKALTLLALPAEERERFMEDNNVIDMSARQLEQAIRERDEALRQAELDRADREAAEQAREKMAQDMAVANQRMAQAAQREAELTRELDELKSRPVDVAVQHAEEEDIQKARQEAEQAARTRVDALERELEAARKEKGTLLEQQRQLGEKLKEAKQERRDAMDAQKAAQDELERVKKEMRAASSKEITQFGVYFDTCQEDFSRMVGILHKLKAGGDDQGQAKLTAAAAALLETMRKQLSPFQKEAKPC